MPLPPSAPGDLPGRLAGHGPPQAAADEIVAALRLPASGPAQRPDDPLPLPALHDLPHDASMLYAIGRVDHCGRVTSRPIVEGLRLRSGSKLEVILADSAILLRASSRGLVIVPCPPRLPLPARARRRYGIQTGDCVLLAAARDFRLVIVHPAAALDAMVTWYHARKN
jgi:hypothetical protein